MAVRPLLNVVAAELRELLGFEAFEEWRAEPEVDLSTGRAPTSAPRSAAPPGNQGNVRALLAITKSMPRESA